MIIDTHIHENKYSFDSFIDFKSAIEVAKLNGLNGICITNHDNDFLKREIGSSIKINDVLVLVGAEILTFQGDILVFGVDNIPEEKLSARELLEFVKANKGAAVVAHPFRTNNRGLGNHIRDLKDLITGVESFNGSTKPHHNLEAYRLATELAIPSLGASDSHRLDRIGTYATKFHSTIRDMDDFVEALHYGNYHPVMKKDGRFQDIDYHFKDHIREDMKIQSK